MDLGALTSARLTPVTDSEEPTTVRGAEIKRRRLAHGIKSVRVFAEQTGVDRQAISKAEAGSGTPGTLERLEAWLDKFDHETQSEAEEASTHQVDPGEFIEIEMIVEGDNLRIVGKGAPSNMDEVRRQIAALYRETRG